MESQLWSYLQQIGRVQVCGAFMLLMIDAWIPKPLYLVICLARVFGLCKNSILSKLWRVRNRKLACKHYSKVLVSFLPPVSRLSLLRDFKLQDKIKPHFLTFLFIYANVLIRETKMKLKIIGQLYLHFFFFTYDTDLRRQIKGKKTLVRMLFLLTQKLSE